MKEGQVKKDRATELALQRLGSLSNVMDAQFRIPGSQIRFGLDSLIGLIPGIGDAAGLAVSSYILLEASRLGATRPMLLRMISNIILDALIGAIPILGDLFDVGFKANSLNVALLEKALRQEPLERRSYPEARSLVRRTLILFGLLGLLLAFTPVVLLVMAL